MVRRVCISFALAIAGLVSIAGCQEASTVSADQPGAATTAEPTAPAPSTASPTAAPTTAATVVSAEDTPGPVPAPLPTPGTTLTGAAVLAADGFGALHGLRVGLIAHQPSMVGGERLADLIAEHPAVELGALFAPEHGLFGTAGAGELVGDITDPATGVAIYSLYGETRSPSPASLAGLDALVYDLQDVGARFFTYTSTLGLAMQAAAEADIEFIVLDRPNPLGGDTLQGPPLETGLESFIGMYPVPSAYGLTAGELAVAIKGLALLPGLADLDLSVVAMQGWTRSMRWPDTGLDWIAPSPNLMSADAALLYPGTVLFEATTISEGRGTTMPFQVIGAPWLDGDALAIELNERGLPGVRFEPAVFTPEPIAGAAPSPRFLGEELQGVMIQVTNANDVRGVEVGLHVIDAVLRQGEAQGMTVTEMIDRPTVFDRLSGSAAVRAALEAGRPVDDILTSFEADHLEFREAVAPAIIYD